MVDQPHSLRMARALDKINEVIRTRSTQLDLSRLGLTELPRPVEELRHVEDVDLADNQLVELPFWVNGLTGLRRLSLARNQVRTLPGWLSNRSSLEVLDLSYNDIPSLPAWLGTLKGLRVLRLTGNPMGDLPRWIGHFNALTVLDVSATQLRILPDWLAQLAALEELVASSNSLTNIPISIGFLAHLRALDLSSNSISQVPDELGNLSRLESLSLASNRLERLPSTLGRLEALRNLYLGNTRLKDFPPCLRGLKGLTFLALGGSPLRALPPWINSLESLETLDLAQTGEVVLSWTANRGTWAVSSIAPNPRLSRMLPSLPPSIKELTKLRELYLHGNARLGLPSEVLGPTWLEVHGPRNGVPARAAEILEFYFRARQRSTPLNEAKLILVGRGAVGKTSLVERLVANTFSGLTEKTQGIQITAWPLLCGRRDVRLNVWDFGGQEIMHATHQFFLTERSLYLVVLTGREGAEDYDVDYWLKSISSFAGESPVMVVLNKYSEQPFELNYRALQTKYPQIRTFVKTDCKTPLGIEDLRKAIRSAVSSMPDVRIRFPASWFAIKDKLASMSENYLTLDAYRTLCSQNGETVRGAQDDLAGFLHRLGIALHYRDDPRLRDTSVLNPRWVTSGIYSILNSKLLASQKGVLSLDDLREMLPADYPEEKYEFLMELMRRFRLCFAFPDSSSQHRYLIPELLDKQEPDLDVSLLSQDALAFEYQYCGVLPEGLLPTFIVRTHILSNGLPRWRSGVVLRWQGCHALVKADVAEKRVSIRVIGPTPDARRELLAVIRSDFERMHGEVSKLDVEARIPLPGLPGKWEDYNDLVVKQDAGERELTVAVRHGGRQGVVRFSIQDLLNGVDLQSSRPRLGLGSVTGPFRVFISYAHKDETFREELATQLKLLERQGQIVGWSDRNIGPGANWQGEIDENLERADVVLALVSPDFLASDFCHAETQRALQRAGSRESAVLVLPIIVRDSLWACTDLGKLLVLPEDGKAIKHWADRDSAWRSVAEGIQRALGDLRAARTASRVGA